MNAATGAYGTVTCQIKVPRPPAPSIAFGPGRVAPRYISVSTQSFAILTDGKNPVIAGVNLASGNAVVSLRVPAGTHNFTVTAYDRPAGKGNVLSTDTTAPVIVPPAVSTRLFLTLGGVVAGVALALAHTHVTVGSPAVIDLKVLARDADGNTILGGSPLAAPFTLTSSDPVNGRLSQTTIVKAVIEPPQAFQRISVAFSGANVAKITFSAGGAGLTSVTPAVLTTLPVPSTGEQILVTGGDDPNTAFSTANGFQLLATFGVPPQIVGQPDSYGAAAVDAPARLVYVTDFIVGGFDIYTTNGAYALVDAFDRNSSFASTVIDADAKKLYAGDTSGPSISIFSTATGHALLGRITDGFSASDLAIDPVGKKLYVVAGNGPNSIQVVSTVAPYPVLASVTDDAPQRIALDVAAGRLYVEKYIAASPFLYVDVYDTASLTRIGRIGPLGTSAGGIAVGATARRLYVLQPDAGVSPFGSTVQSYGLDTGLSFQGSFTATSFGNHNRRCAARSVSPQDARATVMRIWSG